MDTGLTQDQSQNSPNESQISYPRAPGPLENVMKIRIYWYGNAVHKDNNIILLTT
jgi:hypothetical protein